MNRREYLATVGVAAPALLAGCSGDSSDRESLPPASEVKSTAETVPYDELLRNAEEYDGANLHFPRAEIMQMLQGDDADYFNFRLSVNDERNDVFATWQGDRYIEDDVIECWGVCFGTHTYETAIGSERTIPGVDLVDINLFEGESANSGGRGARFFEIERIDLPDSAQVGEGWSFYVDIENTSDEDRTFESPISVRLGDSRWDESDIRIEVDVPAHETATWDSGPISHQYMGALSVRVDGTGDVAEVDITRRQLSFGDLYEKPDGVLLTSRGITFEGSYTWSAGGSERAVEPDSGNQFAFVDFYAINESNSSADAPSKRRTSLIVDGSQYDYEYTTVEGGVYEGGDTQPGVERSGWIMFEVPEDIGEDDATVVWSESSFEGEIAASWSTTPDG